MYSYSIASKQRLETCHEDLQLVFNTVIEYRDCTILEGHRGKKKQIEAYEKGTGVAWPLSAHNKEPSNAADVMPYYAEAPHIRWPQHPTKLLTNFERGLIKLPQLEQGLREWTELKEFANFVLGVAAGLDIPLRWGGQFKRFYDGPHYERILTQEEK